MKYGIMGGTFSPIHIGHLILAEEVREKYGLDKIFFVPSGRPPHKEQSAGGRERLRMVELAIKDHEHFEVLDLEIKKKSYSYTIETVRELRSLYPDDVFYFVTGADVLTSLDTWHEFRELAASITFVGANRPGVSELGVRKKVESLRALYDFRIELVEIPSIAVSSSEIRRRVNFGQTIRYMVPRNVEQYIYKYGLYVEHHPLYQKCLKATKARLSERRYLHSLGVARAARALAIKFGEDYKKAELAGLIHDYCKEDGADEARKAIERYRITQYECLRQNPVLAHGEIAAGMFLESGMVIDEEILDAVRWHTYGTEKMSRLAKIVYVADIIEDGRTEFPGQAEVRAVAMQSVDEAILAWQPFEEARKYPYSPHPNSAKMFADIRENMRKSKGHTE